MTLDSAVLLYTYISRFSVNPHYQQQFYLRPSFIPLFNFPHKHPMFAFTVESGYTPGSRRKIAHNGSQGETGAFPTGALSLPSDRFARFGNPAWPGGRTVNFAVLSFGRVCSRRIQKAFGAAMRLCASLLRRRRGPAGLQKFYYLVCCWRKPKCKSSR